MRRLLILLPALFTACSEPAGPIGAGSPAGPRAQQPQAVDHDFGVIPHGESRSHDYEIDTSGYDARFVPLRVQLDCSCGRGQIVLRAADGSERFVDGSPQTANAQQPGETLIARVVIDTLLKDPVDLPSTNARGYLVLQPTDDRTGLRRVHWPLLLRFGIDSPVEVKPFSAVEFGKVPQSAAPEALLLLSGDDNHQKVRFGPAHSSDAAITAVVEQDGDATHLRVRCRPGAEGNYRAVIGVDTDMANGYRVNLSVTWKVVPDLELYPLRKLSFRARFARAQTEAEASSQYLQVVDHDRSRGAEFEVRQIVGDDGRDVTASFAVRFEPLRDRPRHHRVFVRYLGGLESEFRGRIVLTKGGDAGPFLPIPLVVFAI